MIVTRKSFPPVLRGIGAALALPLLDGMVAAFASRAAAAAGGSASWRRLCTERDGDAELDASDEGAAFEFTPILRPLSRFGIPDFSTGSPRRPVSTAGAHARASTRFLTGVPRKLRFGPPGWPLDGPAAARELGHHTQFASLELPGARENAGILRHGI